MIQALLTSVLVTAIALVVAVPLGLGAGTWLHEYGPDQGRGRFLHRLVVDMSGVPSLVYGLFGAVFLLGVLGLPTVVAGGATLGLVVLPVMIRRVERALEAVPTAEREAALALGASRFQVVTRVVVPRSGGRLRGVVILAGLQALGEAAPLLVLGGVGALPVYLYANGAGAWPVALGLLAVATGAGWWADHLRRHG